MKFYAEDIRELKEKAKAIFILFEKMPTVRCEGTFRDELGSLVFCDIEFPEVIDISRRWVSIFDRNRVVKIQQNPGSRAVFVLEVNG